MLRGEGQSRFRTDERGVTVQIGAVMLFGILIIALATWQATVVPDQNAGVEFDHSRTVQSDMGDLRNGLIRAAATGTPHPTSVNLGTRYPDRVLFVNPPPASGTLRSVGVDDARVNTSIDPASVDADHENARLYWENAPDAGVYDTGHVVYTPDYAEYRNAPTIVYENSLLVDRFDGDTALLRSGQTLVNGNTINLLALRGDLSEASVRAHTVDARPVSEMTNTVTVRSTAADPLVLAVTSRLPASTWESSVLADQAAVVDVAQRATWTKDGVTFHRVAIELRPGSYELRAGAVGIGALTDDEARPDPAYLVAVDGYDTVGNETNGSVTVEVRDRFNNPVSDAPVNVSVDTDHLRVWNGSAWNATATVDTDADGRATLRYRAVNVTSSGESASFRASIDDGNQAYETVEYPGVKVPVVAFGGGNGAGDGGGGSDLNPGSMGDLVLRSASLTGADVAVSLENTVEESVTVTHARLNFFYSTKDNMAPDSAVLAAGGTDRGTLSIKSDWVELDGPVTLSPGQNDPAFTLEFQNGQVFKEDFFVLTVVYEIDGERYRATYFISPDQE